MDEPVKCDLATVGQLKNLTVVRLLIRQLVNALHDTENETLNVNVKHANPGLVLHRDQIGNLDQVLKVLRCRLKVKCHSRCLPLLNHEQEAKQDDQNMHKSKFKADFCSTFNEFRNCLSVRQILRSHAFPKFSGIKVAEAFDLEQIKF